MDCVLIKSHNASFLSKLWTLAGLYRIVCHFILKIFLLIICLGVRVIVLACTWLLLKESSGQNHIRHGLRTADLKTSFFLSRKLRQSQDLCSHESNRHNLHPGLWTSTSSNSISPFPPTDPQAHTSALIKTSATI